MSFIKKIVVVAMFGLAPISAKWESFYARGAFSLLGASVDGNFSFTPSFSIAGGYGNVIPNMLSHGLYVGLEIEGIRKSFGYSHEAIFRFGLPRAECMFFVAPKLGYHSTKEIMIWGLRTGMDFDFILPGFFWGISLDWSIPFKETPSWIQTDFSFGYRF
ncbi:hypothetical protein [Candidatus Bodocaedibacter vickermanii]|uniref:Uncharacterized protein n=1 Tax=Candidatus Bodocaedibacter vickermanii TaxID=2741701 RepID=A0A7L9RSD2_9PROT|nr:hypothetical protein CPBP_00057 [Candidatus Paracaedibacteraceae bacterium 'Lake Konstanz']